MKFMENKNFQVNISVPRKKNTDVLYAVGPALQILMFSTL